MRKLTCLLLASSVAFSSCRDGAPSSTTSSLLGSGSEGACVTPEVEQRLREMLSPAADDIRGSQDARGQAIASLEIEFRSTTQDAFDDAVNKVSCSTEAVLSNGAESQSQTLRYTVSPDARDPASIVVKAPVKRARLVAIQLAQAKAMEVTRAEWEAERLAEERAAKERLATMVERAWLTGWWFEKRGGGHEGNCLQVGINYRPDGTFSHRSGSGTWLLEGLQIKRSYEVRGNSALPSVSTVTAADINVLEEQGSGGEIYSFERCSDNLIADLRKGEEAHKQYE